VILNPAIPIILMAKFNPIVTVYAYIAEGHGNKKNLLLGEKVEHISYTMVWPWTSAYISGKALVPMV